MDCLAETSYQLPSSVYDDTSRKLFKNIISRKKVLAYVVIGAIGLCLSAVLFNDDFSSFYGQASFNTLKKMKHEEKKSTESKSKTVKVKSKSKDADKTSVNARDSRYVFLPSHDYSDPCDLDSIRKDCCSDPAYPVLGGLDVVHNRLTGEVVFGDSKNYATTVGVTKTYTYWFSKPEYVQLFEQYPELYMPKYGGFNADDFCENGDLQTLVSTSVDLSAAVMIDRHVGFGSPSIDVKTCDSLLMRYYGKPINSIYNTRCVSMEGLSVQTVGMYTSAPSAPKMSQLYGLPPRGALVSSSEINDPLQDLQTTPSTTPSVADTLFQAVNPFEPVADPQDPLHVSTLPQNLNFFPPPVLANNDPKKSRSDTIPFFAEALNSHIEQNESPPITFFNDIPVSTNVQAARNQIASPVSSTLTNQVPFQATMPSPLTPLAKSEGTIPSPLTPLAKSEGQAAIPPPVAPPLSKFDGQSVIPSPVAPPQLKTEGQAAEASKLNVGSLPPPLPKIEGQASIFPAAPPLPKFDGQAVIRSPIAPPPVPKLEGQVAEASKLNAPPPPPSHVVPPAPVSSPAPPPGSPPAPTSPFFPYLTSWLKNKLF
jgi:hypothetical protein